MKKLIPIVALMVTVFSTFQANAYNATIPDDDMEAPETLIFNYEGVISDIDIDSISSNPITSINIGDQFSGTIIIDTVSEEIVSWGLSIPTLSMDVINLMGPYEENVTSTGNAVLASSLQTETIQGHDIEIGATLMFSDGGDDADFIVGEELSLGIHAIGDAATALDIYTGTITFSEFTIGNPTSPVPVPGAVWLFGTAISALVARRKLKE